jgi:hypothetical protein
MMNPHMAEDITILEQYLSHKPMSQAMSKPYRTIPTSSGNPIVYLTVPRKRKGLKLSTDPGSTQREIIEQVLGPHASEVRQLYFTSLHFCFPIIDEQTFQHLWQHDSERISSTLMCDIYASALLYWKRSDMLRGYPRPDLNFVWNQAVSALQEDFLGPTISTVHAALLDMVGRPVGAVTGNIVNAGRVVTLAQSLGLHRDPSSWNCTTHEKNVRIRLWWGVVIHDHWSSIGHGIPPSINPDYYDVPLVTLDMLEPLTTSKTSRNSAMTFIYLCKLTQILGNLLPHIYTLRVDFDALWKSLKKTDCKLDDWLAALPTWLSPLSALNDTSVNGSSSLWFSYLSVKLLFCRLTYRATLHKAAPSHEACQYRLAMLRDTSCMVIDYTASLTETQLQEFWLPYTSYLLVTAATILLRCTIECGNIETKKKCIRKLIVFRDRLRRAKEESGWDLADFCLERCEEPIQKFATALRTTPGSPTKDTDVEPTSASNEVSGPNALESVVNDSTVLTDLLLPLDTFECPWDTLWDAFDTSWPI